MHTSDAERERLRSEAPQTTPNSRSNVVGLYSTPADRAELSEQRLVQANSDVVSQMGPVRRDLEPSGFPDWLYAQVLQQPQQQNTGQVPQSAAQQDARQQARPSRTQAGGLGTAAGRSAQPAAAAAAAAAVAAAPPPAPAQDEHCDADTQQARPWSPDSAVDYSDMPSLINASPQPPIAAAWELPTLSPVRHFLAAPPHGSSDDPAEMELDESDDSDSMPPLVSVGEGSGFEWLAPTRGWYWRPLPQQVQGSRQQQDGQQREEQRLDRLNMLSAFPQIRPPHATGPRSRPSSSRRQTGPVAGVMARALPGRQEEPSAVPAPDRRDIDALYASAVQQVWSRTARLSADLLPTLQAGMGQEQQSRQQQQQQRRQQQQEEQQEYVQLQQVQQVPLSIELCQPPAACSFLQPGLSFVGSQKLLQRGSLRREDQWTVRVVLHAVDYSRGRLSGSMQALDVAGAAGPIDTYWEGDIIDDLHNSFWTQTWGASRETDLRHWSKFSGFADIKPFVIRHDGRCGQLQHHPTIFMRWKEQFFINAKEECGLTIAGFYYVALDRSTGAVRGLYFDPSSSPFQELNLQLEHGIRSGAAACDTHTDRGNTSTQCAGGSGSSSSDGSSYGQGVSFTSYSFA